MPLQIIYGRAHSGKTQYILSKAEEFKLNKRPFIIVVPEQFTHLAEKKLISKIGAIEHEMSEVISFNRMATRINSKYPVKQMKLATVAKSLIMAEAVSETEFNYYKNISSNSGFVDSCINEISEFKKYNLSSDDIFSISENIDDEALSLKLSDLARVYKKYDDTIAASYVDSDDYLEFLYQNLEKYKPYKGYRVIFDEFSSFNPKERKIIASLASQADEAYLTLCGDLSKRSKFLFKPVADMGIAIEDICKKSGCEILNPVILKDSFFESKEMQFIENNLYSFPCDTYKDIPKNIRIYSSETPYTEIKSLASRIKSLVSMVGTRYRDIGVVCPDIDSYSHIIRTVFKEHDIPYFIDEKTNILSHSIVCFVLNFLDVYLNGYTAEDVTNFLKSGHVNTERNAVIDVDKFINATNISKNTWLNKEKWTSICDIYCGDDHGLRVVLDGIRNSFIIPLASLHDRIKGRNTVKYITENLYKYLLDIEFDKNILGFIDYFKKSDNTYMAKQYEAVWDILIESFDVLVMILGNKTVNLTEYRGFLYTALSQQSIGIIPTSIDSVTIGDIKRSKSDNTRYQFIIGACDGVFPSKSGDGCIINDADKEKIAGLGVEFSPDSRNAAMYERYLTYLALSQSMKSLVISYPMCDVSFASTRPSFVITILKNLFPFLNGLSDMDGLLNVDLSSETAALEFLASSAYCISEGNIPDERWQDVYTYFKSQGRDDYLSLTDNSVNKLKPVIKLDKELIDRLFRDEFYSTISRIQRYNSCRYSYYLEYMLKLKENETYGPQSTDIGTFVHSIIEKTFIAMNKEGMLIENADEAYFRRVTKPIFEEDIHLMYSYTDEPDQRELFKIDTIKESVINALINIKAHFYGSAFKPLGHEITFDDDNVGCIELDLPNDKKLRITGKIDRADSFKNENGTYIRVVDYKTGNKTFSLSDVYHGLDIQLIVYLNTLVKNTADAHHAGALYFRIQNPIADFQSHPKEDEIRESILKLNAMTGMVADDESVLNAYSANSLKASKKATFTQFGILSDYVEAGLKNSAAALSDGNIEINPYSKSGLSPCIYCKYRTICGFRDGKNGECRKLGYSSDKIIWDNISKASKGDDNK